MSTRYELQQLLVKMGGTPASGDNTDETIRKIADAYSGEGGGSSLPAYENSDLGKFLKLKDSGRSVPETITTIQEQNIVITNHQGVLAPGTYDFSKWEEGEIVSLTFDGQTYNLPVQLNGPYKYIDIGNEELIVADFNGAGLVVGSELEDGTYAISATMTVNIPIPEVGWDTDGSIQLNPSESQETTSIVLDKTYSELSEAYFKHINVYFYYMDMFHDGGNIVKFTLNTIDTLYGVYHVIFSGEYVSINGGINSSRIVYTFSAQSENDYPEMVINQASADNSGVFKYASPKYYIFYVASNGSLGEMATIDDGDTEKSVSAATLWSNLMGYMYRQGTMSKIKMPLVFIYYAPKYSMTPVTMEYVAETSGNPSNLALYARFYNFQTDSLTVIKLLGHVSSYGPGTEDIVDCTFTSKLYVLTESESED